MITADYALMVFITSLASRACVHGRAGLAPTHASRLALISRIVSTCDEVICTRGIEVSSGVRHEKTQQEE